MFVIYYHHKIIDTAKTKYLNSTFSCTEGSPKEKPFLTMEQTKEM